MADAAGLSWAGLLHVLPSKEALHGAVLADAEEVAARVVDEVGGLPDSADRDRAEQRARTVLGDADFDAAHSSGAQQRHDVLGELQATTQR